MPRLPRDLLSVRSSISFAEKLTTTLEQAIEQDESSRSSIDTDLLDEIVRTLRDTRSIVATIQSLEATDAALSRWKL